SPHARRRLLALVVERRLRLRAVGVAAEELVRAVAPLGRVLEWRRTDRARHLDGVLAAVCDAHSCLPCSRPGRPNGRASYALAVPMTRPRSDLLFTRK